MKAEEHGKAMTAHAHQGDKLHVKFSEENPLISLQLTRHQSNNRLMTGLMLKRFYKILIFQLYDRNRSG